MRCACLKCGYIYVPETGDVEHDIAPGTRACDLPPEWTCPKCKSDQDYFAMMEEDDD